MEISQDHDMDSNTSQLLSQQNLLHQSEQPLLPNLSSFNSDYNSMLHAPENKIEQNQNSPLFFLTNKCENENKQFLNQQTKLTFKDTEENSTKLQIPKVYTSQINKY
jgi:hypothetical protein